MNIEYVKIKELQGYEFNTRTHSDSQVNQLAASIGEFGFTNPLLIDGERQIIAGHGRFAAATKLQMDEVPCIVLDHLSEAQRRAYVIADNKLALNAGWDEDLLKLELSALDKIGFDLSVVGFDEDELSGLVIDEDIAGGLTDEDDVPEVAEIPISKQGDIWLLGEHRVMCGDSTSAEDVGLLMNGEKADICFTSPPYNAGSLEIRGNKSTEKKYNSFEDNQTSEDYFNFLYKNLVCMMEVSNEVFYNIGLVQNNKNTIFQIITEFGDKFKDIIYWKKNTVAPHIQKGIVNNLVEFIICFGDGKRKFLNPQFSQGSYWNVIEGSNASSNDYSDIHKATFPVYLPENIIDNFSNKNSIVIDCFLGSGTTLIAAEKKNRKCYGMELDEKYCDVIVKRWQEYTGKKAIHAETGEQFVEVSND